MRLEIGEPGPTLTADRRLVAQMVLNLLSNALKFTSDGVIAVRAWQTASGASTIAVEDTGRGIPADVVASLGKPFYQAPNALGDQPGNRPRLSIVKEMMALHGGSLDIRSAEGVGTTVTLSFPPPRPGLELRSA